MADLAGTYVIGTFEGVEGDRYPSLVIQAGERRSRINYTPFDPMTGASVLPPLTIGERVAVRVWVDVKPYSDKVSGEAKHFVAYRAIEVVQLGAERLA